MGQRDAGRYLPLEQHLRAAPSAPLEMSFAEIEALVGRLPPSARRHRMWWGNFESPRGQIQAWRAAGRYVLEVDLTREVVMFSDCPE